RVGCRQWPRRVAVNAFLDRMGRFCARRHWIVIVAWVIILGALLLLKNAFGGEFVNDYTVPGSQSSQGFDLLNDKYPQQGGYAGQIVFHAKSGKITDSSFTGPINTSMTNVG